MASHLRILALAILCAASVAKADILPILQDTTTRYIVNPSNILGFRVGGQFLTNLVGHGLANSNGVLSVTISSGGGGSGSVTNVGLLPWYGVGVSPTNITTGGAFSLSWSNQTANTIFAGPTTGGAAAPTFRSIVDADIPDTITIDLAATATVANSGDSATAFFSSGTIEAARLGSGSGGSTKFLREDSTWQTISGGGDALVANPLSQFAATTSAQLAGVLSDETGTGAAVFADSPTFAGTVAFSNVTVSTLQFPFASRYAATDASSNLVATSDGGSWTNLNASELRSGTVPDARIDSAIARDAEVAAAYQPLDADLTDLADGSLTGSKVGSGIDAANITVGTLDDARIPSGISRDAEAASLYQPLTATLTRLGDIGAGSSMDLLARDATGWTNFPVGSQGQYLTRNGSSSLVWSNLPAGGSWDGSPIASGTITNLTTERINGKRMFLRREGGFFEDGTGAGTSAQQMFGPTLSGFATSSGTVATDYSYTGSATDPGRVYVASSATANSGYTYGGFNAIYLLAGNEFVTVGTYVLVTNLVVARWGLIDQYNTTEPTDGVYFEMANGNIYGKTSNNSSRSTTSSVYVPVESYTVRLNTEIELNSAASTATFRIYTNSVLAWTDSLSANIPTTVNRYTGPGFTTYHTSGSAGLNIMALGWFGVDLGRTLNR